ncbi:MAG: IPTL-CTERM sorting domain-containing protein [Burkholderiales bacterium]
MTSTHTCASRGHRPGDWLPRLVLLLALSPVATLAAAPQDGAEPQGPSMPEQRQEAAPLLQAIKPQAAKSVSRTLSGRGCQVDAAAQSPGPRPSMAPNEKASAHGSQGCAPVRKGPASSFEVQPSATPHGRSGGFDHGGLQQLALLERAASARVPPTAMAIASGEYGRANMLVPNLPTAATGGEVLVRAQAAGEPVGIPTLSQGGLVLLAALVGAASMRMSRKRG